VFLLACVLAFVGWQWWHQQAQVSNYAAGQSALADVDWDAALSYFSQAGDYRDAASQAQHAQAQVAERNRLYNSAQHHAANNQWLDSLADVRAAALIQPGYLNLDAQEKTSLQNVYTAALSGTIAMRTNVTPPGLYYYSGTDWVYLQDSDDKSAVFGSDTQGRLIYDVPGAAKGSTPLLASPPYMQVAVSSARYYRVAILTDKGFAYSRLDIDPEHYVQIIMNANGVWGFSYGANSDDIPDGYNRGYRVAGSDFVGLKIACQSFTGNISAIDSHPTFTGTSASDIIIALDPQSNRYLSVNYTNAHGFKAGSDTIVKFYLNEAGSTTQQLVYTHVGGGVNSAQLSQDGRYVLVNVNYSRPDGTVFKASAVLIDLQNTQTPHLIEETTARSSLPLGSAFVQEGVFAGDPILLKPDTDGTHLILVDPSKVASAANPQGIVKDVTVTGQVGNIWVITKQDSSGVMLAGQDFEPSTFPITYSLNLVDIPAQGQPTAGNVETQENVAIDNMHTNGDTTAWVANIYPRSGPPDAMLNVYTATLATGAISPTLTFTTTYDPTTKDPTATPHVSLSDNLIAYTLNNRLHVRTYNGSADIALESGISRISNPTNDVYTLFWNWLK
jgi:hypothetical protein